MEDINMKDKDRRALNENNKQTERIEMFNKIWRRAASDESKKRMKKENLKGNHEW